ncbi:BnaA09g13540D [Brassica napus]|uniref:BnaA09g13540D protein n=2 Tax=Brassica napus TaxID=3708 RepID=A0A078FEV8_BRANA|nr:BnaA09g13540D [Brassica napus]
MKKGLIGSDEPPPVGSALACTDELFLRRYVRKHDDDEELVAELMGILRGSRAS